MSAGAVQLLEMSTVNNMSTRACAYRIAGQGAGRPVVNVNPPQFNTAEQAALDASDGMALPSDTNLRRDAGIHLFLSSIMGNSLMNVGAFRVVTSYGDLLVAQEGPGAVAGFRPETGRKDVLFSPRCCMDGKVSPVNLMREQEFSSYDGNGLPTAVNPQFWNHHKSYRNRTTVDPATGTPIPSKFVFIEIAALVPAWVVDPAQRAAHDNAVDWFNSHSCGLGGGYLKLVLYAAYAHVFCHIMESPLVCKARLHGFFPLLLLKETILQKSRNGLRGMHLSSVDVTPKSCLMIVAFWRARNGDANNVEVISLATAGESFLTINM
jgi:hypothetical protein